jgi:intron-binding protein aquarius
MIGDHHQLPPVIQNMAYQKYSNMEQSLFARFIRLGVPAVQLDAQGRARSRYVLTPFEAHTEQLYFPVSPHCTIGDIAHWEICRMWKNATHFNAPMPVFCSTINSLMWPISMARVKRHPHLTFSKLVLGKFEKLQNISQNLGEAEYAVAIFMYMRLLGYPAEKISLLTTYNGQKHLLHDVVEKRCAANPMIGRPFKVRRCFWFFLYLKN